MRVLESGEAFQPIDLVLLEQELDAAGQFLDRSGLLVLEPAKIELGRAGNDAEFR